MAAMVQMKDNEFDLAIVDPPYGIGMAKQIDLGHSNYKVKHKTKEWDNATPTKLYFIELMRVSINQIIWGGNYFIDHLRSTKSFCVWDKENGGNNMADCELAWTSFDKPVRMFKWHIFTKIGNSNYVTIHPTQKPVALYKWLLKNYAKEGDRILDTHLGSGSSRIAAYDMGFDFVGYEIDKDYFDAQELRFNNHIKQGSLFDAKDMY